MTGRSPLASNTLWSCRLSHLPQQTIVDVKYKDQLKIYTCSRIKMQKKKGDWSASTFAEIKIPSLTWNLNYTSQHVTSVKSSISWMRDSLKTWIREHPCWLMSQIGWRPKIHRHASSTISSQHIWEARSLVRAPIWHHRNPCCVVWTRWQFRSLELILTPFPRCAAIYLYACI
jgi:hypothetical protein